MKISVILMLKYWYRNIHMMRRKTYDVMARWKSRPNHTPLVISGQRQIGKTYLIRQFAEENYANVLYLDLSIEGDSRYAFEGSLNINEIVNRLQAVYGDDSLVPGSTVIILDEIQECPNARTALKQFALDGRFDVIASGSLLGVIDNGLRIRNEGGIPPLIPLGYEERITMTGMDFEEFLWALKFPVETLDEVKRCIREKEPIDEFVLSVLEKRFAEYQVVGGMPESVDSFVKTGNYAESTKVIDKILASCIGDMNRYNVASEAMKTTECFNSIPSQLADSNKKFTYSRLSKDKRTRKAADKYMENLLWIQGAGYGNFCYALQDLSSPLLGRTRRDSFKVYLSDTGMLVRMYGQNARLAVLKGDTAFNMGAVTENIVAECLMKGGFPPRYYRKTNGDNKMELDFVAETTEGICAIEVKSGAVGALPSLSKAGRVFDIARRIVLYNGNIIVNDEGIEFYPLFAAAFTKDLLGSGIYDL